MSSFNEPGLYFHQLGRFYKKGEAISYAVLRFVAGGFFVPHGIGKIGGFGVKSGFVAYLDKLGVPLPTFTAYTVTGIEVIGGLLIAIGLFTRAAAVTAMGLMVGIIAWVHWKNGFLFTNNGYEYQLMWFFVLTYILFRGSGRYSMDGMRGVQV
ncbi:MAG: DoxX family protein [Alphaproteobacteria bacterium GM202ARS2]|nr:DoxX family protein [Alphaproteobacteria bacterium GM202ARS2]